MKQANAGTAARRHRSVVSDANWQEWISEPVVARSAPAVSALPAPINQDRHAKGDSQSFYEAIARAAYAHWEARGCPHGSPEVDWFQAEQEVRGSQT